MTGSVYVAIVAIAIGICALWTIPAAAVDSGDLRTHSEQSFEQLKQQTDHKGLTTSEAGSRHRPDDRNGYSSDAYLIGKGQGDLAKGAIVCQRVSELSARTDLAKQIRILVKEHMVDHVREHPGKDADQDIELTREEIVQEYLQGVKIVDHQIDEEKKTCSATAVMPKSQIQSAPAPVHSEITPTLTR